MMKKTILFLTAFLMAASSALLTGAEDAENTAVMAETAVNEPLLGDVNGDGGVDFKDALSLFQYSMTPELYPIDYTGSVDFDKNVTVDLADALRLFQYSMLPDAYPIGWGGEAYRPADFDLTEDTEGAVFRGSNGLGFRYRLYVPEDYDPKVSYPLLVCLHSIHYEGNDNEKQLTEAEMLFEHPTSPAYRSIVLIPQCPVADDWGGGTRIQKALMELIDSVNETYNTDPARQYYVGIDMGADGVRQMMATYPNRISAAVLQGESGIYFLEYNGEITVANLPEAMAEIPVCLAYNGFYSYLKSHAALLQETLSEMGAENFILKECFGKETNFTFAFAAEDDISVLQWLYAQNRLTDPAREEPPVEEKPKVDVEYALDFDVNADFEYGEFTASNGITIPYRYFIPFEYEESEEYPVLLFLHTNGQQGMDNERHMHQLIPLFTNAKSPAFNSIVIAPQCPTGGWWHGTIIDAVAELLDCINEEYSTDRSRQYAMGVSMGGDGTWDMVIRYPEYISAAAPVCGVAYPCSGKSDGTMVLQQTKPEAFDVHVCHVYDTVDKYFDAPRQRLWNHILMTYGSEESTYRETNVYGHAIPYVTDEDISLLEWLFERRRETTGGTALADGE